MYYDAAFVKTVITGNKYAMLAQWILLIGGRHITVFTNFVGV